MSDRYVREKNVWEILGGMFVVFIVLAMIGGCINEGNSASVKAPDPHPQVGE